MPSSDHRRAPGVGFRALTTGRKAIVAALAAALTAGAATGCGGRGGGSSTPSALPAGCTVVSAPAPKQVHLPPPSETLKGPATATVETSCGSFQIALDTTRAPKTTSSFAYLARQGTYDD